LLDTADPEARRRLRVEIARAASDGKSTQLIRQRLGDASAAPRVTLELLRALGDRITTLTPEASDALERLRSANRDFKTQYLLLAPSAELAASDEKSREFLRNTAKSSPDWRLRSAALAVIRSPSAFQSELVAALADPEVRVREAAATTLANGRAQFAAGPLAERLSEDRWPVIRSLAASAIGRMPADGTLDAKLGAALDDESPLVRGSVITSLGMRRVRSYAKPIRERFEDPEERREVRTAAALALGAFCDTESVEPLTKAALKVVDPMAEGDQRAIGLAAVAALARISPPDIRKRFAPLLGKDTPKTIRRGVEQLLKRPGNCSSRGPVALHKPS
jgi:HEAT repeat protein